MNAQTWSHQTFCELMAHSPKQAFEYRFRVLGDAIPEQYIAAKDSLLTEEDKVELDAVSEKVNEIADSNPSDVIEASKPEITADTASSEDSTDADSENVETPVKKASKNAKKA